MTLSRAQLPLVAVAVLLLHTGGAVLQDRPRVRAVSGHLQLEGGSGKNITLKTQGSGAVVINGVDVAGSLSLVSAVRPQLESLHQTDLSYLVTNLSRVARTVASQTWLNSTIHTLTASSTANTNSASRLREDVTLLQNRIQQSLDPLIVNVSNLGSQLALVTNGSGSTLQNVNTQLTTLQQAKTAQQTQMRNLRETELPSIHQRLAAVESGVASIPSLADRIEALERQVNNSGFDSNSAGEGGAATSSSVSSTALSNLRRAVRRIRRELRRNECESGPCQNGGTCIDGYLSYTCLCRKEWQGQNCEEDIDECYEFFGTDFGCQNNARCTNTPGGYTCECTTGWYGIHCSQRTNDCSSGTDLCGPHGNCIQSHGGALSYTCICDEGWKRGNTTPACVDVNECTASTPHCSRDPPVHCVNYPGGFACGPCPQGFNGNGFVCNDINECLVNNGGCSPFSTCYNNRGGRRCGPCAAGYTGTGEICQPMPRPCLRSPCHPLATCVDNPHMCVCPPNYQGSGFGPHGCVPNGGGGGGGQVQPTNLCQNQPCQNGGTCVQYTGSYTYTCTCVAGYTGLNCEIDVNECASNPCLHGGTCTQGLNSYTCLCPSTHTGDRCQTENEACGGRLTGTEGIVAYPGLAGQQYNHNISCAWRIIVPRGQVLTINFSYFHLEGGNCRYDWLQIHDGGSSRSHLIGRFCGTRLPGNNGTVTSTHNGLYLWFRSDHSIAGNGFNFTWNATDPVCGEDLSDQEYGSFNSPGYPGNYPINRDCYWTIRVQPGKRIKFVFATLQLEHHDNCSMDYLEVRDGLTISSPSLGKYCSTVAPAPVTSSGSEAFVHFHSDWSLSDTGFHVSYLAEPGIAGCGGLLTEDMGEFSVPTISDRYSHNIRCEWLVRVPPGETITLNFTAFNIERHPACRWDYVEIRDGGAADSPRIGKLCGNDLPDPIQSTGNQLFIIFQSDSSVSYEGFTALYQVACGGEWSGDTGIIRSPYHPQPYPHNRECIYIISQDVGKAILLNFTEFNIERPYGHRGCVYDYVEVRDGRRTDSPSLGRYCGTVTHGRQPNPILSTHNYMWVKFVTDASVSNRGFVANYTTIDVACGGILTDLTGVINSPNSPDTYPGNTDCRWVLDLPPGYVIHITWHSFFLEQHHDCQYDFVEIFDNSSSAGNGGQMGQRYCGSTLPPIMTSSDNMVTIHFHSDASANHDGFSASYHGLDVSHVCGGHYHTEAGVLTSPNYPNAYSNSRICEWTITVPTGQQIRLTFNEVEIEESDNNCYYDALEIRDGSTASSPLLRTICSRNKTVPELISHTHQLYLKFRTDGSFTLKGFNISWDGTNTGCGGTLTAVTGEVISPGYPNPYHHRADCYWTIHVAQGSIVRLHFTDLDLEAVQGCFYDFVEVRNGPGPTSPLLGRYCSASQGFITVNSTDNVLWIRFKSDNSVTGRGFRARYITECNRVIRGPRGVIVTPNYPNPYPHNRNCTWVIKAPLGNSINASFSHFVLEEPWNPSAEICHYDFVEVREAQQSGSFRQVIGKYCRKRPPPHVATASRNDILEINFVSDEVVAENGFRLEWIINGCGGEYNKLSDTFSSPNYPNAYPINTECEWYITTHPGTKIQITIHDFDLESSGDCIFDDLRVYGGPDRTSPMLTHLCHKSQDVTVTTQGNRAYLYFVSDQSVRGKGFNISYITLHGGCGGVFTSPEGTIHSPNYPQPYDANSDCIWTITVDSKHTVELTFTDFNVEHHHNCSYDFLVVYDGNTTESPELLRHCGNQLPSMNNVKSTTNSLTIQLRSDEIQEGRGFTANYTTACGAWMEIEAGESGELISPHYPNLVTSGLNCSWHLKAPEGSRVLLHIAHLDIHSPRPGVNCTSDYLEVLDGAFLDSPVRGRYCGSHVPRALVSSDRFFTVTIVIEYGRGVGFRATYSVFSLTCGGELTSISGELATPEYPEPYPASSQCEWHINAGAGNQLQLNFQEFDIEENDGCNVDYVEVHERHAAGPLLLHNCSSTVPPAIIAHESLWIRFRSGENTGGSTGFLADYSLVFGNELTGESGEIVSPLYPHVYRGSGDITWVITAPRRRYVSITILEMDIEKSPVEDECFASLVILNGRSNWRPRVLGTFCGYSPPPQPIVTTWRVATVRFHSLALHEGSRFKLRYEAVDSPGPWRSWTRWNEEADSNCSFTVRVNVTGTHSYSSWTTIKNPGYPGYANNLNCEWIIISDPHERISMYVSYELENFGSSCFFDQIMVFDGLEGTTNWNLTATVCQRRHPRFFVSSGRYMRIRFLTDSSVSERGFIAYVAAVCGGYLSGSEGAIATPGYPENYWNGQHCVWKIKVGMGRTIKLEFDDFKVVNTTATCGGDSLLIRNGATASSPFLGAGRFCGNMRPSGLESSSNKLTLEFISDGIDNDKGFKLRYYEQAGTCGGQHQLSDDITSITLTSPSYPNPPDPHTECYWVVMAPPTSVIGLHFEGHFEIEEYSDHCDQAFVEVRDGGTFLSPLLGTFCGSTLPGTQYSTGNTIFVRYYNNVTQPHAGFKAVADIGRCGATFTVIDSGYLTFPFNPGPYPADVNCTWRIVAPLGHYLAIQILSVDISAPRNCTTSNSGRLDIRETNATGELLSTECGREVQNPLVNTASNIAYITFRGDTNTEGHQGFRLMYNVSLDECGGDMVGSSGEIQSPGYPHGYSHRRQCVWTITTPPGTRVKLDLVDVDIQADSHWCYGLNGGWLSIRNGIGPRVPHLKVRNRYDLCGSDIAPASVNASMNHMTIMFFTRGHSNSRGFKARWSSDEPQECGGILESPSGTVSSPGLDQSSYNHSLYCVWTVSNPNAWNSSFTVSLHHFELEHHCFDFILVKGVKMSGEEELIKKICGHDETDLVVVPFPTLKIVFITDTSISRTGWNLTYGPSPCGGERHGPQSIISSPNYPSNYPANTHCAWVLNYNEGEQIDLEFTNFVLEDSLHHDYVLVHNGPHLSSPQYGHFTGSTVPKKLTSMTNALLLEFHTDATDNFQGFRAIAARNVRGCGGIFHGLTGNFSSHGFPEGYDSSSECEWQMDIEPGYHIILKFVDRFDIETSPNCQNDFVQVFHSQRTGLENPLSWTGGEKMCGKQAPADVIGGGEKIKVLFRSNDNDLQGDGFKIEWDSACGNNYTDTHGIVMSPSYPNEYQSNSYCVYRIIPPSEGHYVVIQFMDFQLEGPSDCRYDNVTIENGYRSWRRRWWGQHLLFGPYCGTTIPENVVVRGTTNIIFKTDRSYQRRGFKANYTVEECGGNITTETILKLPMQSNYHHHMSCTWNITAPEGKVSHLKFQLLKMEAGYNCRHDSLSIYDGHTSDETMLVTRMCGDHTSDLPTIVTPHRLARLKFTTDYSVSREGFRAALVFTYACGGNVNISRENANETIRSLDADNDGNYENMLQCLWLIEGLEDQVVTITFSRLDIEPPGENDTKLCPYDSLEIRDGPSITSPLIRTLCNVSAMPGPISSSTNIMLLVFKTDSTTDPPRAGFTAHVSNTPHPCGAASLEATNQTQSLSSPGYPVAYPVSTRCRWIISAPEGDRIELDIDDMNLEYTRSCTKDQLHLSEYSPSDTSRYPRINAGVRRLWSFNFAGHQISFPMWYEMNQVYCGTTYTHHIRSETNAVEVRFISDETTVAPGFSLKYFIANCNRTYNGSSGTIKASGRESCFTTIYAPEGQFINLYFRNFYIRKRGDECGAKALTVYEGETASGEPLQTLCGSRNPSPIHSTGSALHLAYTPGSYGYYNILYTTSTQGGGCGGMVYVTHSHWITSPGYPGPAPQNLECIFAISVTPYLHAGISFSRLDFGGPDTCNSTYLEVYYVTLSGQSSLADTLCGGENEADHLSPTNRMILRYVTGSGNQTGQGWQVALFGARHLNPEVFDDDDNSSS